MKARPVLRETAMFGTATFFAQVLSALRGLVIADWLGPASYGLWKSVQVGLDYLAYTHFGVLHGMARQIPLHRERGEQAEERMSRRIGLRLAVSFSLIAGFLLVTLTWGTGSAIWKLWACVAGLSVLEQLFRYALLTCQADGRFAVLSVTNVGVAAVSFATMVWSVPRWGVYGVFVGLAVGYLFALVFAWTRGVFPRLRSKIDLDGPGSSEGAARAVTREIFRTGFPFMFVDGLFVFWKGIDRVVLIFLFGMESNELGYYGLAATVANFAIQFPQVVMKVLFRRTLEAAERADEIRDHLDLPVLAIAGTTPLLYGLGAIGAGWMVEAFLPAYVEAIPVIAVLLAACYWTGVGLAARNLYTATNRQWRLAAIYSASILVTVGVVWFTKSSGVLAGGTGMFAGSFLFAFAVLVDTGVHLQINGRRLAKILAGTIVPFVLFGLSMVWVSFLQWQGAGGWVDLVHQTFVCVALNIGPFLWTIRSLASRSN